MRFSRKDSGKNSNRKNGLRPSEWQKSSSKIIINNETGKMFKMKNNLMSSQLTGYFNSLSSFDVAQYKRSFEIDLDQQKSADLKYLKFGSSICISESNFLFSIGGVDSNCLFNPSQSKTPVDLKWNQPAELRMDNVMFTPDSLYFLRSNNDPRIFAATFVCEDRLFVCGGISVFGHMDTSNNAHVLTGSDEGAKLSEIYREGLSDRVEVYDFGLQNWVFHKQALPFPVFSMKTLRVNSHETILFDGKVLDSENRPVANSKLVLYNCKSETFSEWVDLCQLYDDETSIQDVLICKNAESSELLVLVTKNHSDCAFELEADLFVFDSDSLEVRPFRSFSNRLVDKFNKKVFKPIQISQNKDVFVIMCRHLHMRNCLFKCSVPIDFFREEAQSDVPLKFSQIKSNSSIGTDPLFFQKPNKHKQSLFPLALSKINEAAQTSPDLFIIKNNFVSIYNLDQNSFSRRQVPEVLTGFFSQSESLFLNDDLVLICGGFKVAQIEGRVAKEPSRFCFVYSIAEDKWIAPVCVRNASVGDCPRVTFVNSDLLLMNSPKTNHKMLVFKKSGTHLTRSGLTPSLHCFRQVE